MYAVSDKFKQAVKNPNRKSSVYGTLTTVRGAEYALNDRNIIKDSLYVTNQIVNDNKLCFGAVYAGECGLVINSNIDRYSLFGARIELFFAIELDDGTSEEIPLGIFYVDTPERIGSKIKLVAVDNMSKFDVEVKEDSSGTFYELVLHISKKCGVELAQTQEEIEALHVNALKHYAIQKNKIEIYRDALSYLATVICSNATIDRNGKLKFVQYATSPCDSNDRNSRLNNCKFSDYTTKYNGMNIKFSSDEAYFKYEHKANQAGELVLDCGEVPIAVGTSEVKSEIVSEMYDTLKQIAYTPATLYISSNPAYELGDMIECKNINNSSHTVKTYVMAYTYDYRKKQALHCYGENPLLKNVKSKTDKRIDEALNEADSKEVVIVEATNASKMTFEQSTKELVALNFTVNTDCRPVVICTVPFSIDVDGYVEFYLCNGAVSIDTAVYKGYYLAGEHFATFMYLDHANANERRSLRLMAKCYADTNSVVRKQEARIKTLENGWKLVQGSSEDLTVEEVSSGWVLIQSGSRNLTVEDVPPDMTEPTVTIEAFAVKAIVYAQGINANAGQWDGTIEVVDNVSSFTIQSPPTHIGATDTVQTATQNPTPRDPSEVVSFFSIGASPTFSAPTDRQLLGYVIVYAIRGVDNPAQWTFNENCINIGDGKFALSTLYTYTSVEQPIDSGRMCSVAIKTSDKASIEGVVIK